MTPTPLIHASSESLVEQSLAILERAEHHIANQENDPQALEQAKVGIDLVKQMQTVLRSRLANLRRQGMKTL